MHFSNLVKTVALASLVVAHPGHDIREEIREREAAMVGIPRSLAHCAEQMEASGILAQATARRAALVRKAREERGLDVGS
jgi:hypothetical protein